MDFYISQFESLAPGLFGRHNKHYTKITFTALEQTTYPDVSKVNIFLEDTDERLPALMNAFKENMIVKFEYTI